MCPYHHSVKRNVILGKRGTSVLRESWGLVLAEKLEFCIMEAIEFKFEERLVTKAVGLPQEGFDLVVDAFHPAVVDAVLPPVQDSTSMEGESFGQLLHLTNVRVDRPLAPFFEEALHGVEWVNLREKCEF